MSTESNDKRNAPQPQTLPRPTYWPMVLALGTSLAFWGLLTSWLMVGLGVITFTIALTGWLGDLRHENENH